VEHRLSSFDDHATRLAPSPIRSSADADILAPGATGIAQTDEDARRSAARERANQGKSLIWEVAQTVLLTVAIFLAVRMLVQNFRVEGASMDPTLKSGQFLLINKIGYLRVDGTPLEMVVPIKPGSDLNYVFGGPARGDIIVFHSPGQADKDYIKRIIGLPGDTVQIRNGQVIVNGAEIDEPYIKHQARYDWEKKTIPRDSFFVLGDNRPNSSDSHVFGTISAESIVGRAWLSYWPPNLWGVVHTAAYTNLER
jgi:signal peptidase I